MRIGRLLATASFGAALWLILPQAGQVGPATASAQEELRPAVGNPLAKAKSLMAAHSYAAANAQVNIADRQKGKTANESFVIQEMRGAIAQASGDTATASRVFQELINSGRLGGAQLTQMLLAQTSLSYQLKDYPATISWAQRYAKAGGKDPSVRTLVIQSYYLQHDYPNAARAQSEQIADEVRARKTPPEDQLQLLAACQKQIPDNAGLAQTMEQLVTYYPKQSYWADLLYSLQVKPGLSDRLELDIDRFKMRVNALTREADYMQMAQLAMGENDPGGAANVVRAANASKVFGTGPEAPREARLSALVNTAATATQAKLDQSLKDLRASPASTSQDYYELGQNFASAKRYDPGIGLMQEAIAKGDLRRPEIAQLRVAEALVDSGDKAGAMAAFHKVPTTTDGTSDLARLWLLWLRTQPAITPLQ